MRRRLTFRADFRRISAYFGSASKWQRLCSYFYRIPNTEGVAPFGAAGASLAPSLEGAASALGGVVEDHSARKSNHFDFEDDDDDEDDQTYHGTGDL
jgi:hypothetical protein